MDEQGKVNFGERLSELKRLELEERGRQGYLAQPQEIEEYERWESITAWPAGGYDEMKAIPMTTVQIEISDQQAAALQAKATALGVSSEQYARQVLEEDLRSNQPSRRHISDVIHEITSEVPLEVFENLPRDGASEHDHYLYGAPKKNQ